MSEEGTGGKDEAEAYDSRHGHTTLADEQRLVNLSEGSNKEPPQAASFKVTQKG